MNNGKIAETFFNSTDTKTKNMVLKNIANHYGITNDEAFSEVTDSDAEHLLEYVTGPERAATYTLMKLYGL